MDLLLLGLIEDEYRSIRFGTGIGVMYFPISDSNFYLRGSFDLSGGLGQQFDQSTPSISGRIEGGIGYELIPHLVFDVSWDFERDWTHDDYSFDDPSYTIDTVRFSIALTGLLY